MLSYSKIHIYKEIEIFIKNPLKTHKSYFYENSSLNNQYNKIHKNSHSDPSYLIPICIGTRLKK